MRNKKSETPIKDYGYFFDIYTEASRAKQRRIRKLKRSLGIFFQILFLILTSLGVVAITKCGLDLVADSLIENIKSNMEAKNLN